MLTKTQTQRKASAAIRRYIAAQPNKSMQFYFVRGNFHINNIDDFNTAKTICEAATGMEFKHFTNSIAKLIYND